MIEMTPIPVTRKILEKDVEARLVRKIKKLGGECYKWNSQNVRGVPDRVVVLPNGEVWFVELKRDTSCRLSPLQNKFFNRMVELNMKKAITLSGMAQVDWFIDLVGKDIA